MVRADIRNASIGDLSGPGTAKARLRRVYTMTPVRSKMTTALVATTRTSATVFSTQTSTDLSPRVPPGLARIITLLLRL